MYVLFRIESCICACENNIKTNISVSLKISSSYIVARSNVFFFNIKIYRLTDRLDKIPKIIIPRRCSILINKKRRTIKKETKS